MPFVSRLFGPTAKIKDIQGQAKLSKGRKRPEDSVTAALVYWFLLRVYLLLMSGILLGQRASTYHGNLISKSCKSRVTACKNSKSRIMLWCPVPHHADNLGTITRHPANFGAITRHVKTLCHPLRPALYLLIYLISFWWWRPPIATNPLIVLGNI